MSQLIKNLLKLFGVNVNESEPGKQKKTEEIDRESVKDDLIETSQKFINPKQEEKTSSSCDKRWKIRIFHLASLSF